MVDVSGDGRFVVYGIDANQVNPHEQVYLHDRDSDEEGSFDESAGETSTTLISGPGQGQGRVPGNGSSFWPRISEDGAFVTFISGASDLAVQDTNSHTDVYVYSRLTDTLVCASLSSTGEPGDGPSGFVIAAETSEVRTVGNGGQVAWASASKNLVPDDNNNRVDTFVSELVDQCPTIVRKPEDLTACEGGAVTLSVLATGEGLSYRWYWDGIEMEDESGPQLGMTDLTPDDAGLYHVVGRNPCGFQESRRAVVTVNGIKAEIVPAVSTVAFNDSVTLDTKASGAGLTYQWYHNGQEIVGATGSAYLFVATRSSIGTYRVVVKNAFGCSIEAFVEVKVPGRKN